MEVNMQLLFTQRWEACTHFLHSFCQPCRTHRFYPVSFQFYQYRFQTDILISSSVKMCSVRVWQSSDFNCISYVLVIIVLAFVIIGCTTVNLLMNGRWRLFGTSFRVRDTERPAIGVLRARNLSFELKTVANWCLLGINLGVPIHELSRIE